MKNLLLLFSFLTFGFIGSVLSQNTSTIMIYMVGSDLESKHDLASTDIDEMIAGAANTSNVNVIVLTGGANKDGWQTLKSWKIENGQKTELNFTFTSNDMGSATTVTEFINQGTQNYQGAQNAIIFWNHGGGLSGYGWDEVSHNHLSIPQIKQGLQNTTFIQTGHLFDLIGFDACLMASLEMMHGLDDAGIFMVASEEVEPGNGWDYKPIIEGIQAGQDFGVLGLTIANGFIAQSQAKRQSALTLSVVGLWQVPSLETKLETLFNKIKNENKVASLQRAVSQTEEYGKNVEKPYHSSDLVDIGDLMRKLKNIDPSLSAEADEVLSQVRQMTPFNRHDSARPNATGIAMYIPHNVLSRPSYLNWDLQNIYAPLNLPTDWNDFIVDTYVPFVTADSSPPGFQRGDIGEERDPDDTYSSLTITHDDDLEHVHIVLDEEFLGIPNEYILLGSTIPDSIEYHSDSTETYYYFWDEQWLGINGHPAYIADIHDFYVEDSLGNQTHFDRIHIPAILNWGTSEEQQISMAFLYDDDFNVTFEGIHASREETESGMFASRDLIEIEPGDQIYLMYEVFDEITDEEFFIVDEDAVITIENGLEDLHLEQVQLEAGTYHIGYALLDHSHNDTIIWDPQVFEVLANDVEEPLASNEVQVFPNPSNDGFYINIDEKYYGETFTLVVTALDGRTILSKQLNGMRDYIDTRNIPSGIYTYNLISGEHGVFTDKIVIQH